MTSFEIQLRSNLRNYLYPMTIEQMEREVELSHDRHDALRARIIEEYIAETRMAELNE